MQIGPALTHELSATKAIFNYWIGTNATPEREQRTETQHEAFARSCLSLLVARDDSEIVGFSFVKSYAELASFDPAAEVGLYLHREHLGRGIGSSLLEQTLVEAKGHQKHTVIAKIDAANRRSVRLFEKHGFEHAAKLRQIGFKNGLRVTVVYMQLFLSEWNPPNTPIQLTGSAGR